VGHKHLADGRGVERLVRWAIILKLITQVQADQVDRFALMASGKGKVAVVFD
jgi:hypothetical protein